MYAKAMGKVAARRPERPTRTRWASRDAPIPIAQLGIAVPRIVARKMYFLPKTSERAPSAGEVAKERTPLTVMAAPAYTSARAQGGRAAHSRAGSRRAQFAFSGALTCILAEVIVEEDGHDATGQGDDEEVGEEDRHDDRPMHLCCL
jgi:hypothetical protein